MTQQYLRKCQILVGNGTSGFDASALRCVFNVNQATVQSPTSAYVRIYNVSEDSIKKQLSGHRLVIKAGYDGQFGTIFDGDIIQQISSRENAVDTVLELVASDGLLAYQSAVTVKTVAAGYTVKDLYGAYLDSMKAQGISEGFTPDFGADASPRGRVLYGSTKDYLRDLAWQADCEWAINQRRLDMVPRRAKLDESKAVVINASSGLVGSPQQTQDGINLTVLLNPKITGGQQGSWIKIDNSVVVNKMRVGTANQNSKQLLLILDENGFQVTAFPSISQDGFYRVYSASHVGDTRGHSWYTNIVAVARGGAVPPFGGPFREAV